MSLDSIKQQARSYLSFLLLISCDKPSSQEKQIENPVEVSIPVEGKIGRLALATDQDGVEAKVNLFYEGKEGDFPLSTMAVSEVCAGQKFYDAVGDLKTGTKVCYSNCTAANQTGCITTATYRTMDLSSASVMSDLTSTNLNSSLASGSSFEFWDSTGVRHQASGSAALISGNVRFGVNLFGVAGSVASSTNYCTGANQSGCVATAIYRTMDLSLANDSIADLDAATFNAKVKSSANFEYWNSAGQRQTGSGDADITDTNIKSSINIFGTDGSLNSACSYGNQASCTADMVCQWTDGSCRLDPWNIRVGRSIGGVSGALKVSCGNTDCGRSVWRDLTADGVCDAETDDCVMQDRISGLMWSEQNPATGSAPSATAGSSWSNSVSKCENLSYGGYSDWRLPTQKELLEAYMHGIRDIGYKGSGEIRSTGSLDNNSAFIANVDTVIFVSASSSSGFTNEALFVSLKYGTVDRYTKNLYGMYQVLCVR